MSNYLAVVLDLTEKIPPSDYVFFTLALLCYVLFSAGVMIIASCTCLILVAMNKGLRTCLTNHAHRLNSDILRSVSKIYCKICEVTRSFSMAFGFMILPFMLTYISYAVLFFYSVFVYQRNPDERLFYFTIMAFSWVSYYTPPVLCYFVCSSILVSESHQILNLVQQISAKNYDFELLKKCNNLELLLFHQQPKFSCGLFQLNLKTLFAMLAGIFSYTVILVQFYDVLKE